MLDIKFIRENLMLCKTAATNKNRVVDWDSLLALDEKRRELISESEAVRNARNKANTSSKGDEKSREEGKKLKEKLKLLEDELRDVELKFQQAMYTVPNVPDASVPVGKDEKGHLGSRQSRRRE